MIQVLSRKYYSEWANGTSFSSSTSDFSTHLKGSVGEKLKSVTRVRAALIAVADQSSKFEIINGNILKRYSGSWIDDGFQPGQNVSLIAYYTGSGTGTAASIDFSDTITNISALELEFSGSIGAVGEKTDHALVCTDKFPGLMYDFGFITDDFTSPYTNDQQGFYYGSINTSTPTVHTMIPTGGNSASKTWYSGDATVKYISSSNLLGLTSPTYDYMHEYEITQQFVINPVFIENYLDALDNGTQPDDYIGTNSPRHYAHYEFRYDLTDPNTSVKIDDLTNLGSVGWFNENYNGFNGIYSISNVVYKDTATAVTVDTLQLAAKTTIYGRLNGSGFTNTSKAGAYFFWAAPLATYAGLNDSFGETFLWDSMIGTMSSGAYTGTGSERIKRFKLDYVSSTRIDFEIDIEFSAAEQTLINPDLLATVTDKYFIGIQAGNTNATDTSDKVIVQADWNEFVVSTDVQDLCRFTFQRFYDHSMDDADWGYTDYKGWKQDGILFAESIILNKANNASLKALTVRLAAYNTTTGDSFDLQSYSVDISDFVTVNTTPTYQQLSLDETRGYLLATDDQFNQVVLFFKTPANDEQEILLKVGVKIDWQSWVKVSEADTIFYDVSLDSKGLGKDASRYSMSNDYQIRLMIDADCVQDSQVATRYTDMSPNLDIYGWGLEDDDPEEYSVVIETFDADDNDLGGAILENADTTMRLTWTPQSGSTSAFSNQWAIHRIERVNANGYNNIDELSSIWTPRNNNILKPLAGETQLKITDNGTSIVTECLIDYTKLVGTSYNLSGRLGRYVTYARYQIARDVKVYDEDTLIMFNCPDTGIAVSNSLRLATLGVNGEIISEEAIALSASYTYQNWKMAVAHDIITNGRPNFYAVCFTGTSTDLYEFVFNGSTYTQSQIFSSNIGGDGLTCIRIDEALEPNSRPYIWFGNRDANIGGQKGFKHAYYDGATWQFLDWKCYNSSSPSNSHCAHPQDMIWDNFNAVVMNYDNPPQAAQYNQGKIAVYTQSSGSVTTPADRADFANWTFVYNLYRNSGDTENQDGPGDDADLAFAVGFERLEVDADSNSVYLITHDASLGTDGARHFSKIYANTASPASESDFTIVTPMAYTNTRYGTPQALQGQANGTSQTSPLQRKNQNHICVIGSSIFITGHQSRPYWVKHTINDWTGVNQNDWFVYTPADPGYDFSTGNTLVE